MAEVTSADVARLFRERPVAMTGSVVIAVALVAPAFWWALSSDHPRLWKLPVLAYMLVVLLVVFGWARRNVRAMHAEGPPSVGGQQGGERPGG